MPYDIPPAQLSKLVIRQQVIDKCHNSSVFLRRYIQLARDLTLEHDAHDSMTPMLPSKTCSLSPAPALSRSLATRSSGYTMHTTHLEHQLACILLLRCMQMSCSFRSASLMRSSWQVLVSMHVALYAAKELDDCGPGETVCPKTGDMPEGCCTPFRDMLLRANLKLGDIGMVSPSACSF